LFLPVLMIIVGIAIPLGLISGYGYEEFYALFSMPVIRLFLFALISLSFFHWAHRFRFTLYDGLQVKHLNELIAIITYGLAIAGTVFVGYYLITF
jgi:fumarate reductase subunit D